MPRKTPKPAFKTRTLTVTLDDETFGSLRSQCIIRHMTGNAFGPLDEFVTHFVKAVEAGKTEIILVKKGNPK